jgi:hypothetical protein
MDYWSVRGSRGLSRSAPPKISWIQYFHEVTVKISASRTQMGPTLKLHPTSMSVALGNSFDSFDCFNFFNLDIFDSWRSSPENSASYGSVLLARALPLYPS